MLPKIGDKFYVVERETIKELTVLGVEETKGSFIVDGDDGREYREPDFFANPNDAAFDYFKPSIKVYLELLKQADVFNSHKLGT